LSDPHQETRKSDHINLAFQSQAEAVLRDDRFYYEPLLSAHPQNLSLTTTFLGKQLMLPLWISSMTGGTEKAGKINHNLAQACNEFGIGMGLGSCRVLLNDNKYFDDFNLRPIIGKKLPFFANLGIAQVEKLIACDEINKITDLIGKLDADGLIIHINPIQEWLQPEGDKFLQPPIHTITSLLQKINFPIIVKEVGQGMGPESIKHLLQLPIAAIDFSSFGGTNFAKLELLRTEEMKASVHEAISYIGHTALEMVDFVNSCINENAGNTACREIIISGGIRNFLDGYYLLKKIRLNSIYAQGAPFLKYAQSSYNELKSYIKSQADGLALCSCYLKVKS
jgi:isopentenyl-diphosphate delta-isomerase